MVDMDSGEKESRVHEYSNESIFTDQKSIEFDNSILDEVGLEVGAITGLAA